MRSKAQRLEALFTSKLSQISSGKTEWTNFLKTAARMYKYDFADQVLIYAQRPQAIACASFEFWNLRMSRWVNRGAKGIALFEHNIQYPRLTYVFELADTHAERNRPEPYLWQMQAEHYAGVQRILSEQMHIDFSKEQMEDVLFTTAILAVEEQISIYLEEYQISCKGSRAQTTSEQDASILFRDVIVDSVAYLLMERCGLNADDYFQDSSFESISMHDSLIAVSFVGTTIQEIAKPILRVIEHTVREMDGQGLFDLRQVQEIEASDKLVYNQDSIQDDNALQQQRSGEYGDSVQADGRLSDTRFDSGAARTNTGEIRRDAQTVSDGTQVMEISVSADAMPTSTASIGNRPDRPTQRAGTDTSNVSEKTSERSAERKRPDAVGERNEPDSPRSGGNHIGGTDSQLNLFGKAEMQNASAFSIADSEAPQSNYQITKDDLASGGAKHKSQRNLQAIALVKQLQAEKRGATAQEQEVLAGYVGWGGLPQAFDSNNEKWTNEYEQLKKALSPKEYQAARASTLNAHYTSPVVIRGIYQALEQFGFTGGKILEPSCGIGNFFGMLPESMRQSTLYGVELDEITGQIARYLYPEANIQIQGFENTKFENNSFDVVVGNVPFGSYRVNDPDYQHLNFSIHNYFIAKSLDKVKDGGIIAVVTSSYTMDQQDTAVREYLSQRAALLGAVRLPNTAFRENAGTEVVTDILFLQKGAQKEKQDWISLQENAQGFIINSYFATHPEMILGTLTTQNTQYGMQQYTCVPRENIEFDQALYQAITRIQGKISQPLVSKPTIEHVVEPSGRNHSFCLQKDKIYYRDGQTMRLVTLSEKEFARIRDIIAVRDCARNLIEAQVQNCNDDTLHSLQQELSVQYDKFTKHYGIINSRPNRSAFSEDASYPLLCSLEILDDAGQCKRLSDIFTKRTIRQTYTPDHAETSLEALTISIGERARVDLEWMSELLHGKAKEEIITELRGLIFENPQTEEWETADAYLSGNVREKLKIAREYAEQDPDRWGLQVEHLQRVQPVDLTAAEIDVRLGATWIPPEYIRQFLFELCKTPWSYRSHIRVLYAQSSGVWNVTGKHVDSASSVQATVTYGTKRINAYEILQNTLNLKDVRIFDTVTDPDGKETRVLNTKETILAQQKQQAMQQAFKEWIFDEQSRRNTLVALYNEKFNSIQPRTYDGSQIRFAGMTPEIQLRPHQCNAVARTLYGGNSLIAHVVGSGKTFTMIAAAMEAKRLGLCHKSMFVVPNHLIQQWASDFLQLYPAAEILVTTKKDFETSRRKKFCARIATGDYDAVIIGHSQFEKIPLSRERQIQTLQAQIDEITDGIMQIKQENGERFTIKQMEHTRKTLQVRLERLSAQDKKDEVVTFEELGVDRLFVDEAHMYKNLFLFTKMRNVAGIGQTEAQKSSDLYAKCQYLDEKTNGRGVIFATGTPVSNSMTELYTMMRYLQGSTLRQEGLSHFDSWASTFGETVTAMELAPEGTGYRMKTRFAKFYNLPELMALWKECADIQTADMLELPVPKAQYHTEVTKPTETQKQIMKALAERADLVRKGSVDPREDNMLRITNDGRNLALDQRQITPELPDVPQSKVNCCVQNVYQIWKDTQIQKQTQIIFCDLSTPKEKAEGFCVYEDIRAKLMQMGVPAQEIAFIHEAKTDVQKDTLFAKVRAGEVRVLLGSTGKMGAGTNVQTKLYALHHLDVPWKPSDIEQREGRIIRQKNENALVHIYRYVTEGSFDAYSWQLIENKQKFISQIMTSKKPARTCEDLDGAALSYAEVKALASGNPEIKEMMDLEIEVSKLRLLKQNYQNEHYRMQDQLCEIPSQIQQLQEACKGLEQDMQSIAKNRDTDNFEMQVDGNLYTKKEQAGGAILAFCKEHDLNISKEFGAYCGFILLGQYDAFAQKYQVLLKGSRTYRVELGSDAVGNITRIENELERLPTYLAQKKESIQILQHQEKDMKEKMNTPFEQEKLLQDKEARLHQLQAKLKVEENAMPIPEAAPIAKEEGKDAFVKEQQR